MPRRAMPRPFAPALERVAETLMPATLIAEVQRAWPQAVGPALSALSEPVSERGGVVRVRCGSAVLAQELDLLSERVVRALNDALGRSAVRALRPDARPLAGGVRPDPREIAGLQRFSPAGAEGSGTPTC